MHRPWQVACDDRTRDQETSQVVHDEALPIPQPGQGLVRGNDDFWRIAREGGTPQMVTMGGDAESWRRSQGVALDPEEFRWQYLCAGPSSWAPVSATSSVVRGEDGVLRATVSLGSVAVAPPAGEPNRNGDGFTSGVWSRAMAEFANRYRLPSYTLYDGAVDPARISEADRESYRHDLAEALGTVTQETLDHVVHAQQEAIRVRLACETGYLSAGHTPPPAPTDALDALRALTRQLQQRVQDIENYRSRRAGPAVDRYDALLADLDRLRAEAEKQLAALRPPEPPEPKPEPRRRRPARMVDLDG